MRWSWTSIPQTSGSCSGRASPKFPGLVTGWVGGQRFCGVVMSAYMPYQAVTKGDGEQFARARR